MSTLERCLWIFTSDEQQLGEMESALKSSSPNGVSSSRPSLVKLFYLHFKILFN